MPNRLADSTSPYLQQHAGQPVNWWEWEPAAFDEAKRRDVPVLLAVGYAACHWCHVMAHESFEDTSTAAYMNEQFVNIKVDREERPDVDAVYMAATTAMTGHGGWPMTCVLDHDGNPFFAGTYFPDQPRHGQPAFTQILQALSEAWTDRREEIASVAENVRAHLALERDGGRGEIDPAAAVETLAGEFDAMTGGYGGAPKFPPSMVLEFLRREGSDKARHMLHRTLAAMAGGGMYDQLGGGFARYSVDRGWVVPHFEKMLYDNAQLLGLYARVGGTLGERIARETADFMLRELVTAEGGLASALDADSDDGTGRHVEGAFYAWTPAQLTDALGVERGAWAAETFSVTEAGTFEHGASTLQLRHAPTDPDQQRRLAEVRARLLDVREQRPRPARDDKVVAAWNGLAVTGLVDAALVLDEPRYLGAAIRVGELIDTLHRDDRGRLLRVSRDGVAGRHAAVLEDLGCVASGFLALAQATADPRWLRSATGLLDDALTRFRADDGGFFDTAADAETLVTRPRDPGDNASPSGTSAIIHALVAAHALTGEGRYRQAAEEALATVAPLAAQAPRFAGWSLAAATTMADGPEEIAVVGPAGTARDALAAAARRRPGAIVIAADGPVEGIPLLDGRTAVDGRPAAYVCRGFVCERPVTDSAQL
ncbi:thioredoxin domain-containing protein [Nocardioides nematodiphilus]|uniref:thioredoxin domain-containing protein n=1 Tax=Nocardioides nematodiphilus TaxID=2849669 RepID=UPI001CD9603F|nr:thioredoxin domain-containing protein [Nocardioides nematodiphilus]MCA1982956.1 thioredoxin domain-containing protein [Nocardioides nematodiphilus]